MSTKKLTFEQYVANAEKLEKVSKTKKYKDIYVHCDIETCKRNLDKLIKIIENKTSKLNFNKLGHRELHSDILEIREFINRYDYWFIKLQIELTYA